MTEERKGKWVYITCNPKGGKNEDITYLVEAYDDEEKAKESIKDFPHCYVQSVWLWESN